MVFRDITHELEVDRMKSEFLSTAAHELRTPMSSIYGFAELLIHRELPDPMRREMLQTIHRQAGVLINLVNGLLDLARIEARRGEDFHIARHDLRDLVREAVDNLYVPGDDRTVEIAPHGDEVPVEVDREKLLLSLTNVLSNAYKYSPGGGAIRVAVVASTTPTDTQVGVQVSDEGIGMTPLQLERMFERFYRADASGNIPGTGLGLAIVKDIAALHGGSVEAQSRPGQGTTVTLWLPKADTASYEREVAEERSGAPTSKVPDDRARLARDPSTARSALDRGGPP